MVYILGGQYSGDLFSHVAYFLGGLFSCGPFSGGIYSLHHNSRHNSWHKGGREWEVGEGEVVGGEGCKGVGGWLTVGWEGGEQGGGESFWP